MLYIYACTILMKFLWSKSHSVLTLIIVEEVCTISSWEGTTHSLALHIPRNSYGVIFG